MVIDDVKGDVGMLSFAALIDGEEIPLFDFYFNGVPGEMLGYILGEDGAQLRVSVVIHEPQLPERLPEEEVTLVWAMYNGLNEVIAQMEFVEHTDPQGETLSDIVVQTFVCDLHYPKNWEMYLHTELVSEEPCTVRFAADLEGKTRVAMFDVTLSTEAEDPVGSLTGGDGEIWLLSLTYHDFAPDDSWSESEKNLVYAMMEDINYMLDCLSQTNGFTFGG